MKHACYRQVMLDSRIPRSDNFTDDEPEDNVKWWRKAQANVDTRLLSNLRHSTARSDECSECCIMLHS